MSGDQQHVVVWDPRGEYWDGAVVGELKAHQLRALGVATLPVDAGLMAKNGVAGYFRRSFGAGVPLSPVIPQRAAMVLLWTTAGQGQRLFWRARLQATFHVVAGLDGAEHLVRDELDGQLRLVADTAQVGAYPQGFVAYDEGAVAYTRGLGEPDKWGGWTVGGCVQLGQQLEGFMGLSLYGAARGARLAWVAVSQSDAPAG